MPNKICAIPFPIFPGVDRRLLDEEKLPEAFIKTHKSFLVNVQFIDSIDGDEIHVGEHRIPISHGNKEKVLSEILGSKLLKTK